MIRCYLPAAAWVKGPVTLSGEEAHHLADVLRVKPGERVVCFDGRGLEAQARVLEVGRRKVHLALGEQTSFPSPSWEVHLAAAVPGQGKFEPIINQATQMGVREITPLLTARTIVRLDPAASLRKQERFTQVALEAMKQSGAALFPLIHPPLQWKELLPRFRDYDRVLIGALEGPHRPLPELLDKGVRKVLILVGPEGDFTPEEVLQADRAGAHRISLGPSVLRCETACVALTAIVSFLLRERVPG